MRRVTLREYARKNRLSLFEVVKKVQSKELRSEQIEEKGQIVQYILLDEALPSSIPNSQEANEKPSQTPGEDENGLGREIRTLREEIRLLRAAVERCCAKR